MLRSFLVLLLLVTASLASGVNVLTQHNDNMRQGANLQETTLTPTNVNAAHFGKLFEQTVDGQVYAQPLYMSGLQIGGTTHNIVFVATEHDSLYAYDADTKAAALWHRSFIDPANNVTTVSWHDVDSDDIVPEIGITGTPVIDATAGTLFVVAKTMESGTCFQRLHALDVATGQERNGSPVVIAATVSGTGDGNSQGVLPFDSLTENQRPGLLLLTNGVIYIAWASHGDEFPAHGWIMSYDENTLAQLSYFITTPNGGLGGIWMAGCGLSSDSNGNIYCSTGNGQFELDSNGNHTGDDYSGCLLRFSSTNGITLTDFFSPSNEDYINTNDVDFGSGGVMLLPDQAGAHPHLGIAAGKDNVVFLFDRDNLGGFAPPPASNTGMYEVIPNAITSCFDTPAYFNNSIYYHGVGSTENLKQFSIQSGSMSMTAVTTGTVHFGKPGATPIISASGSTNGLVWEIQNTGTVSAAVLHATLASNVSQQVYSSRDAASSRDVPSGQAVKFSTPTVANGKVYMGTFDTLSVYGLLAASSTTALTVNISGSGSVTSGYAGTTTQQIGAQLTLTATASPGSSFVSWTDSNGSILTTSSSYTFTVTPGLVLNANFSAIPTTTLTVNVSGSGSVTSGYSGATTRQIGAQLTVTGSARPGSSFVSWTDSNGNILTTSSSYTFTVTQGLVLNANFSAISTTTLTVNVSGSGSVTSGFAGTTSRQIGAQLTVTGSASPGSSFVSWTDSNGTILTTSSSYTFTVTLGLVLNANFGAIPTTTLTVNVSGSGSVTSGFAGTTTRQIGAHLTLAATPSVGARFANWTGTGGNVLTTSTSYSFTVTPNLTLTANFAPFVVAGKYSGIIEGTTPALAEAGSISLTVNGTRAYTGTIRFGGKTYSLRGTFGNDGTYTVTLQPTSKTPTVVTLILDGNGGVTGTVSNAGGTGNVTGQELVTTAAPVAPGLIGKYTMLFPAPAAPGSPQGVGFGSATVDKFGHIRFSGVLGDHTTVTQSTTITQAGEWPFYVRLNSGTGLISGILKFENLGASHIDGPLYWFKTRRGLPTLSATTNVIGSAYKAMIPILNLTNTNSALTIELPAPVSEPVVSGVTIFLTGTNHINLRLDRNSGVFSGTFADGKLHGTYGGAVFQDQSKAQGTYIQSGTTGAILVQ